MKLWHKIFLLTLFLTITAVNVVSFVLLANYQRSSLLLAKDNVQIACEAVVIDLERGIQDKKQENESVLLANKELMSYLADESEKLSSSQCEVIVSPIPLKYHSPDLLTQEQRVSKTSLINSRNEKYAIQVETTVFWEGEFFRVKVKSDVSELFAQFHDDLAFSQWFGGIIALIIAAVLLAAVRILTHPLKQLEATSKQITGGNYQIRIPVKGHDEIAGLSEQMNRMSAGIEARVKQIEEISSSRKTFIANMTHELKTPLTSILGFADLLKIRSDMTEEERRDYASIIAAEAKRLRLLSSKLMELISLEECALELKPVCGNDLVRRAVESFTPICEQYGCTVQTKLQPLVICADESLFTSLILNLLDNALKASSPGQSIEVCLNRTGRKTVLSIEDHGTGIPGEHLAHVTEAFYMVDKSRSRSKGGAGIGLSLCRAITQAHHGTFEIDSRENYGTTVRLTFPEISDGGTK